MGQFAPHGYRSGPRGKARRAWRRLKRRAQQLEYLRIGMSMEERKERRRLSTGPKRRNWRPKGPSMGLRGPIHPGPLSWKPRRRR